MLREIVSVYKYLKMNVLGNFIPKTYYFRKSCLYHAQTWIGGNGLVVNNHVHFNGCEYSLQRNSIIHWSFSENKRIHQLRSRISLPNLGLRRSEMTSFRKCQANFSGKNRATFDYSITAGANRLSVSIMEVYAPKHYHTLEKIASDIDEAFILPSVDFYGVKGGGIAVK